MLSLFPDLIAYGLIGPLILRAALGIIFFDFGWTKLGQQKEVKAALFESLGLKPGSVFVLIFGVLELAAGALLIVGLFTQGAAFFAALISLAAAALKKRRPESLESSFGFLVLCFIIALSLLFTGAGFLAFDLTL